jgi:hypothetical protein
MSEKRIRIIASWLAVALNLFVVWFMYQRWKNHQDLLVPLTLLIVTKIWINQYLTEGKLKHLIDIVEKAKITRSRNQ